MSASPQQTSVQNHSFSKKLYYTFVASIFLMTILRTFVRYEGKLNVNRLGYSYSFFNDNFYYYLVLSPFIIYILLKIIHEKVIWIAILANISICILYLYVLFFVK